MPIPSESPLSAAPVLPTVIEPVPQTRRSVFGNYAPLDGAEAASSEATASSKAGAPLVAPGSREAAFARSFVFQFLARGFEYPSVEGWRWLTDPEIHTGLRGAIQALEAGAPCSLHESLREVLRTLSPDGFARLHDDYITAIGHAARGSCPINEIEYGDLKADPLFQPHRLADLAAFYRAFGLELGATADERHDHLCVELEFMAVLAAQEAHLLNQAAESEALAVCRDAQRKFLREHLGRWTPAFARRLERAVGGGPLGALARFAVAFVENECHRFALPPGSEDLLLRPADAGAALCEGCGLAQSLPGAGLAATP